MIRQAVPQTTFTSFISLVIAVFRSLLDGSVGPSDLVLLCAGACIALRLGFKLHIWFQKAQTPSTKQRARIAARLGASGNYLLPPFLLYLSSPLLLSLTKATTSDSIWPLAGGLFVLSSILGGFGSDYQDDPKVEEQDPGISALSPVAPTRTAIMPPTIRQEIERTGTSAVPMESAGEDPKKEKAKMYVYFRSPGDHMLIRRTPVYNPAYLSRRALVPALCLLPGWNRVGRSSRSSRLWHWRWVP